MPKPLLSLAYACLALTAPTAATSAAVIAEHVGSANPTTGTPTTWTSSGGGSGTSLTSEAGPPASIRITDASASNSLSYLYAISTEIRDEATANGWKLSANLRLNDVADNGDDFGAVAEYSANGGQWYRLLFGADAQGQVTVRVQRHSTVTHASNSTYTLVGSNTSEFHLYELVYDPAGNSADLFVDGVEVISNTPAGSANPNRVIFGAISSTGLGDANYALVRFETLPEPASLALMAFGGLFLSVRRRATASH